MSKWDLSVLLTSLHDDIHQKLETARKSFEHPGTKGDVTENIWLSLFNNYLPKRYKAIKAFVVDSEGEFSEQMDVVIFDQQYTPFIFNFEGEVVIPAESVYAVFEAKQVISTDYVQYAQNKVRSVRRLHRTSLPIPHAGGLYPPKALFSIYGGILALESQWRPPLGLTLLQALGDGESDDHLDFGCIAEHGYFNLNQDSHSYEIHADGKAATGFLFKLISQLQFSGTVPMINIQAYARWLGEPSV